MPARPGAPSSKLRSTRGARGPCAALTLSLAFVLAACGAEQGPGPTPKDSAPSATTAAPFVALPVPEPFDPEADGAWSLSLPEYASFAISEDLFAYLVNQEDNGTQSHVVHLVDLLTGEEIWAAEVEKLAEGGTVRFAGDSVVVYQRGELPSDAGSEEEAYSVTVLSGDDGGILGSELRPFASSVNPIVESIASLIVAIENGAGTAVLRRFIVREDGTLEEAKEDSIDVACESNGRCPAPRFASEALPGADLFTYDQDTEQSGPCSYDGTNTFGGDPSRTYPVCSSGFGASGFGTPRWTSQDQPPPGARPERAVLVGVSPEVIVGRWRGTDDRPVMAALDARDGSVLATLPACGEERDSPAPRAEMIVPVRASPDGRYAVTKEAVFDLQQGTGQCLVATQDRPGLTLTTVDDDGRVWGLAQEPAIASGTITVYREGETFAVDAATGQAQPLAAGYLPQLLTSTGMGVFLATDAQRGAWVLAGYPGR